MTLPQYTVPAVAEYLTGAVDAAGMRGCLCFGHSAGGAFAIIASSRSPGLFSAIVSFEAVAASPASHAFMREARDSGAIATAGPSLAAMALRRRALFASSADALARLSQKPPLAGMHPEAARLFVQHGTRPVRRQQQQQPETFIPSEQSHWHEQQQQVELQVQQQQQQQVEQQVELVCAPSVEAAYYRALDPPPAVPLAGSSCPLLMLVAGSPGSSAASFKTHAAVRQWLLTHTARRGQHAVAGASSATPSSSSSNTSSSGSSTDAGSSLHAVLAVLNAELAASLPSARLVEVPGVSHFGPLEQPRLIADIAAAFFRQQQQRPRL
uniref:AB hydrolase-1 domain-containing protein n=1 Tax=Tetradesmus obliquus TaxID=3088 RepID=A0A383W5M7_TETOB|eukprot:jgi/Sobl393_1/10856/SZX72945.1